MHTYSEPFLQYTLKILTISTVMDTLTLIAYAMLIMVLFVIWDDRNNTPKH